MTKQLTDEAQMYEELSEGQPPELIAERLAARGFRRTSCRFRIISRIGRVDWVLHMAKEHAPWSLFEGLKWITSMGEDSAEDHYRRCYSKCSIEKVPERIFRLIPGS